MRGGALASVVAGLGALALSASACTVGGGSGTADGELMVLGCNSDDTFKTPQPYFLSPSFFAGQPIEDICPLPGPCNSEHTNRLVIRMQHTANRPVEVNDTLIIDVQDSVKTARCIRGGTVAGRPTWDTRDITNVDGKLIPGVPWCDWSAHPDGGADAAATDVDGGVPDGGSSGGDGGVEMTAAFARINISTQDFVRASLVPLYTCPEARVVGVALPGSWIEFQSFGTAAQPDVPADMRTPVGNDFKVEFGQRLRANFHLILGDQHMVEAIRTNMFVPAPHITGVLTGSFDFDLERGRAAQAFP